MQARVDGSGKDEEIGAEEYEKEVEEEEKGGGAVVDVIWKTPTEAEASEMNIK